MMSKKYLLAVLVPMLMQQALADTNEDTTKENPTHLGALQVTIDQLRSQGKLGERVLSKKQLVEENIQSTQDLVRYNTEVDVAEVGRYGNKGFAVRGVDGNRVAMTIDGVSLPEVEVNELFSPYGYVYEGRFNPDVEMMGSVRITAGADSIVSGSGAVGGAVAYRTKEPSGLGGEGVGGYAKVGYTTKNSERLMAVGMAGNFERSEFLLNYANRLGHELKNHDMKRFDKARQTNIEYDFAGKGEMGRNSQPSSVLYPDSRTYQRDALLAKAYYYPNDHHRLGVSAFYQKQTNDAYAFSQSNTGRMRMPKDQETMKSYGLNYRFMPEDHAWLEEVNANYQHQDVLGLADTWLYAGLAGQSYLSSREYRPNQTKTHQLKLEGDFKTVDLDKFGMHRPAIGLSYGKQDFTSTAVNVDYRDNQINGAIQPYAIYFPDAKKDIVNITLNDAIEINDQFNAKLGLRYDYYKYSPYFQNDTWFGDIESNELYGIRQNINNPTLRFYEDYRNGVYDNKPIFKHLTYSGGFDYQINDNLTARYKVGTGFLAPTVNQMYSAFQGLGVQQIINTELKPETSVNHELEFEFNYRPISVTTAVYYSKYKNFIHSVYWDSDDKSTVSAKLGCRMGMTCIQSQNLDNATMQGIKLGVRGDLSAWVKQGDRLYLTADYHTAKDKAMVQTDYDGTKEINTLAAVPSNAVFGLDYHYKDKASLYLKGRFNAAKKPNDTKYIQTIIDRDRTAGYREEVATYQYLDKGRNTWLVDLYGTYKINKQLSIQGGIYNLTNQKYIPWETLRQFGHASTNSPVDRAGHGFNRYTAPARNYALSVSYEF